jgi:phosphonoacetate hydrolase
MNDKSKADGSPNCFSQDLLDKQFGTADQGHPAITDPYVKHHGALAPTPRFFQQPISRPL